MARICFFGRFGFARDGAMKAGFAALSVLLFRFPFINLGMVGCGKSAQTAATQGGTSNTAGSKIELLEEL